MADVVSVLSTTVIFLLAGTPPKPVGTGFIVAYPDPKNQEFSIPLVVTAKHVVADRDRVIGRFSSRGGKEPVTVDYDLRALKQSHDYWEHPDEGVDLAVFRSLHFESTQYSPLPMELIATRAVLEAEEVRPTVRVVFPGLLVNFLGSSRNYPVVRDGSVALIPDEKVPIKYQVGARLISTEQELIFIDATSVPGASGSPVFISTGPRSKGNQLVYGGKPYLIGVMHGFYPSVPRELIEVEVTKTGYLYAENSGIGIVFPSWRLREILELPELKRRIEALVSHQEPQERK